VFFLRFFVVDDAIGRGEHDVAELTRWQQVCRPFVDLEKSFRNLVEPNRTDKH